MATAVKNINELLAASTRAADQAQALLDLADSEGQRDFTAEEEVLFDQCLADSKSYKEQYDAEIALDQQRAARRAQVDDVRETLDQGPAILTKNPQSRVSQMVDRFFLDPRRGFAHLGDQALAIYRSGLPGYQSDERLVKIAAAATGMNMAQGSQGGFMLAPAFSQVLWDGMNAMPDNLMALTDQYTIEPGQESLTFPANAETSRVTGSRYGGVRGYWIAEAVQITSSIPTVRRMKLEPQELAVLVYVTDKLLNNSTAVEQYLRKAAADEIMFLVNDAILNGNGVGMPTGIVNAAGTISIAKETGQDANTIVLENINKMYARCHARARRNAIWLINQDCEPQLEALSAVVGTGGIPVFLNVNAGFPNVAEAPQNRLKGKTLMPVEYCKTLGTVGDIILANLGYYALGFRGGVNEAMSIHLRFDFAETAFRFMFAVDGQPWLASAITPFNGTNTLAPFLTLATRA